MKHFVLNALGIMFAYIPVSSQKSLEMKDQRWLFIRRHHSGARSRWQLLFGMVGLRLCQLLPLNAAWWPNMIRQRHRRTTSAARLSTSFDDLMEDVINNRSFAPSSSPAETINGWRRISWTREVPTLEDIPHPPSPVDVVLIRDRLVYIKRDDQVR
jgi:hypothetical protein